MGLGNIIFSLCLPRIFDFQCRVTPLPNLSHLALAELEKYSAEVGDTQSQVKLLHERCIDQSV